MNLRPKKNKHSEIHAGALNDILFILLLFFLIISTLANPNIIKVNNPKGESEAKAKQSIVISINAQQQIFLGTEPISINNLETTLTEKMASLDYPTIVINGDSNSYLGTSVKIMQIIKKIGATPVIAIKK
ncbi:MAG: biopolymer transporter ExbD [Alphaproteobacteria bacterium]|nr:biopolymer transporter ExbD [Alphaproteobacteria bacterium]